MQLFAEKGVTMNIRIAAKEDIDKAFGLIEQGRAFLKQKGIDQWQDGYPDRGSIATDIENGEGYVLDDNGTVAGYVCISFAGEEAYDKIDGKWLTDKPYAVIHRMAVDNAYKGKGLAQKFFLFTEDLCAQKGVHSIKVDTDSGNKIMQKILNGLGYVYCGVVNFQNSDKIAFEKVL